MKPLELEQYPHQGIGLELSPEELSTLEAIQSNWSPEERLARIKGYSLRDMVHTFHVTHVRLVDKLTAREQSRNIRRRKS